MTETRDVATILRAPFKDEELGKLPRVTCGDCSDKRKTCDRHQKSRCDVCKSYISSQHIHLDYVGHADVTNRLLEADPEWNWEPKAEDEHGLPMFDTDANGSPVGLWIRLTAGGVTRLGYGSCPSGQNDAVKVLIGDALRNAAMRFGVALDLWAKGDRADPAAENATASGGQAQRRRPQQQRPAQRQERPEPVTDIDWMARLVDDLIPAAKDKETLNRYWAEAVGRRDNDGTCTPEHCKQIQVFITERARELGLANGSKPEAAAVTA